MHSRSAGGQSKAQQKKAGELDGFIRRIVKNGDLKLEEQAPGDFANMLEAPETEERNLTERPPSPDWVGAGSL